MEAVVLYLIYFAVAWSIAYLIVKWRWRKSIENFKNFGIYPFFIIVKSEKMVRVFDKLVSFNRRLWKILSNIGILVALGLSMFAVFYLADNLKTYLLTPQEVGVANIVIPIIIGVTIRIEHLPYLLLAFMIVLVTHEGMHGLVARLEKIKIKSTGFFLAFIFPGGFVEPEEEDFKNASTLSKLRVAAAGSFANLLVGLLVVLMFLTLFTPSISGVIVLETTEDSLIKPYDVVYSVNGYPLNPETLFQNITIRDKIVIETSSGNYTYHISKPVTIQLAHILREAGIIRIDYFRPTVLKLSDPGLEYSFFRSLWWVQLISFGVAIFNMLPIKILDGHLFYMSLIQSKIKNSKILKILDNMLTITCTGLLISNIVFTYKTFGFFQL